MSDTIRVATIGTSAIAERFVEAVSHVDGIRVEVAVSRDRARGQVFADRVGIPRVSDDLDALLAADAADGIDAVYLGSPNGLHAAQAHTVIAAGAHVFVEKPATPTAPEFAALVAAARARGVVVFEGMRNVYDPGLDAVRDLLPEIGAVRRVAFAYCQRSARYDLVLAGETPNIFDPALAGGALFDLGVYPLSALVALFGKPQDVDDVSAVSVTIATGADGAGTVLLAYPGFAAEVVYSKITRSDLPSEVQGERGTIEIDHIAQPRHVTLTRLDGTTEERVVTGHDNNMVYEVERFAQLVRGEADPQPDQDRTDAVLRMVDSIRASAVRV